MNIAARSPESPSCRSVIPSLHVRVLGSSAGTGSSAARRGRIHRQILFALISTRDIDDERCEIVTLSGWTSWDAVRAFAGKDPERARYFPTDDQYLLTRPDTVSHYEIHEMTELPRSD
ncbi:MAG TPA: hypothetical protein VGL34_15755 [Steroidobacteraceae bacterium]